MHRFFNALVWSSFFLSLTVSAQSEPAGNSGLDTQFDSTPGWFFGVGIGGSSAKMEAHDLWKDVASENREDTAMPWKVMLGYRFSRLNDLELTWEEFGDFSVAKEELSDPMILHYGRVEQSIRGFFLTYGEDMAVTNSLFAGVYRYYLE